MSIDKLRAEITEYHMRIEEVLNGMDGVLTSMSNRLGLLEQRIALLEQKTPTQGLTLPERSQLIELKDRVDTLTSAVHVLLVGED